MPGNVFGKMFRITTFGESHGKSVGVVIDGCPPRIPLTEEIVQAMLDKRKPGKVVTSTSRKEPDQAMILSGVFEGLTTGTPIAIMVNNKDAHSNDYSEISRLYRPGHGDITWQAKFGIRDYRGGGRASARETLARVAAGAVACEILKRENIKISAYTLELGGVRAEKMDMDEVENNPFFCPDAEAAKAMGKRAAEIKAEGNSIGGIVEIRATGVPMGLGDPVFDKLDADLAKGLMSIGAVKGVEIGSGFEAARKTGLTNNDPISPEGFLSNNAGGILGGISNGDTLVVRVAVKPIPSLSIAQNTVDMDNSPSVIKTEGRHDVSPIPRINVVCASMTAIVLADHLLRQKAIS